MGKKKKSIIMLLLLITLTTILPGCSTSSGSGVLKVGVRDDIMNFGYLNEKTGKYYGLEIDIAQKLAKDLGYKDVQYVTVQPENRKDMLLEGKVDCLIAAYSIAETRLKNFDFSEPYYKDALRIMVQTSSLISDVKDLKGKKIGVLTGANSAILCAIKLDEMGMLKNFDSENFDPAAFDGGVTFLPLDSYSELNTALEEGTVDAACMDGCIAQTYMNDNRILLETKFEEQHYGVATQKDSKLSKPVAESIQKMLDDGTIDDLIDKWN